MRTNPEIESLRAALRRSESETDRLRADNAHLRARLADVAVAANKPSAPPPPYTIDELEPPKPPESSSSKRK